MYELWLIEMDGSLRERIGSSDILYTIFEMVEELKLHSAEYTIKVV